MLDVYAEICQNSMYMQFLKEYFIYRTKTPITFENGGSENNGCEMCFILDEFSKKVCVTGWLRVSQFLLKLMEYIL